MHPLILPFSYYVVINQFVLLSKGVDSMYSENTVLYKEKYDEMKHKKDIVDKRRKEREGGKKRKYKTMEN